MTTLKCDVCGKVVRENNPNAIGERCVGWSCPGHYRLVDDVPPLFNGYNYEPRQATKCERCGVVKYTLEGIVPWCCACGHGSPAEIEQRERVERLRDVLFDNGFVMCDVPACNCGAWHAIHGLPERWQEICDELRDADVLNNDTGNIPLIAIKALRTRLEVTRKERDQLRGELAEAKAEIERLIYQIAKGDA